MRNHNALVPYWFERHRIRLSIDSSGEAWFVIADVCAALAESPMVWAMAKLRDEEHCLNGEEGPGRQGLTLALISEAGLLRRLLASENPTATEMRRWLTHELLPSLHQQAPSSGEPKPDAAGSQTKTVMAALRIAEEIVELTGIRHSDALAAALTDIEETTSLRLAPLRQVLLERGKASAEHRPAQLVAEQLAGRLGKTIRDTNRLLAACGLQVRDDLDDWQLTETGRNWGQTLPSCARGHRGQQILWDCEVMAVLREEHQ